MARISVIGFSAVLSGPLPASLGQGGLVPVSSDDLARINTELNGPVIQACTPEAINTTVLSIEHPAGIEVIEVKSTGTGLMIVQRALEGTMVLNHPTGACVIYRGLPVSPCLSAAELCASSPALDSLAHCLVDTLIEQFGMDSRLATSIVNQVCASQTLQTALGACIAGEVVTGITTEAIALQALIHAIVTNLSGPDQTALATTIADDIVAALCQSQSSRTILANCINFDILTAIEGNTTSLAKLRALVATALSASAVVVAICGDAGAAGYLADCMAQRLPGAWAANTNYRGQATAQLVRPAIGSGLTINGAGELAFQYNGLSISSALCEAAPALSALATCLRTFLGLAPLSAGLPMDVAAYCQPASGSVMPPPIMQVRIPDPNANSGNVGQLTRTGAGGTVSNQVYALDSEVALADGSKIFTFHSNATVDINEWGSAVFRLTANHLLYSAFVRVDTCNFGSTDGGSGPADSGGGGA